MKKLYTTLFLLSLVLSVSFAQTKTVIKENKPYFTSGGEWIFSTGTLQNNNNVLRFSPVINLQTLLNFDQSESFGWFTGVNIRNVGFIFDESPSIRKKVRNYNLGIPVGVKLGNLNDRFFFAGYELEIAMNYRERTFVDERRTERFSVWFSDRVNTLQHALFIGYTLPKGTSIKAKYYLTSFFNQGFTASDGNGGTFRPYAGLDANIFYVSLNFALFKKWELVALED
ncbi:hypothetical protein MMU07_18170 [Aquiflexum sp. LQ15W]|uniref:hypothetical protein n=1 Tax=Cognataquiflexum nitidum TaxID=2922272 RepID=UPI001F147846|nr:hypothetical protein [Cognataquiflexum nitidum]MCH6201513.1 hypothetical protein [Cognataquiflexum nitidum]